MTKGTISRITMLLKARTAETCNKTKTTRAKASKVISSSTEPSFEDGKPGSTDISSAMKASL
jgi:hypothetical protein